MSAEASEAVLMKGRVSHGAALGPNGCLEEKEWYSRGWMALEWEGGVSTGLVQGEGELPGSS